MSHLGVGSWVVIAQLFKQWSFRQAELSAAVRLTGYVGMDI